MFDYQASDAPSKQVKRNASDATAPPITCTRKLFQFELNNNELQGICSCSFDKIMMVKCKTLCFNMFFWTLLPTPDTWPRFYIAYYRCTLRFVHLVAANIFRTC